MTIVVIDYGLGNIQSVANALKFLGYPYIISSKGGDLATADAFILPGVGAFGEGMRNLRNLGLIAPLVEQVIGRKKPILGLCLGMQLFAEDSVELGFHKGLGWIEGHITRLPASPAERVPHVGWDNVSVKNQAPLFSRTDSEPHFYFDHSYQFVCPDSYVAATCDYGLGFIAAVQKGNIFGVQFHPEKSQNSGLKLLRGLFHHLGIRSISNA